MAEKFVTVTGAAAAFLQANIDTDTIAPALRKSQVGKKIDLQERESDDLSVNFFADWRYDAEDNELPDFILNKSGFREATVILGGNNFGCGSSRESAVWMTHAFGIRCLIAPNYGEIFYNNCFKGGILPIVYPADVIAKLAEEATPGAPDAVFTVDLDANQLTTPSGEMMSFSIPEFRRQGLLQGLDEISLTLQRSGDIDSFHRAAQADRPWAYPQD